MDSRSIRKDTTVWKEIEYQSCVAGRTCMDGQSRKFCRKTGTCKMDRKYQDSLLVEYQSCVARRTCMDGQSRTFCRKTGTQKMDSKYQDSLLVEGRGQTDGASDRRRPLGWTCMDGWTRTICRKIGARNKMSMKAQNSLLASGAGCGQTDWASIRWRSDGKPSCKSAHPPHIQGYTMIQTSTMSRMGHCRLVILVRENLDIEILRDIREDDLATIWLRIRRQGKKKSDYGCYIQGTPSIAAGSPTKPKGE